jgi:hypothetical protein
VTTEHLRQPHGATIPVLLAESHHVSSYSGVATAPAFESEADLPVVSPRFQLFRRCHDDIDDIGGQCVPSLTTFPAIQALPLTPPQQCTRAQVTCLTTFPAIQALPPRHSDRSVYDHLPAGLREPGSGSHRSGCFVFAVSHPGIEKHNRFGMLSVCERPRGFWHHPCSFFKKLAPLSRLLFHEEDYGPGA